MSHLVSGMNFPKNFANLSLMSLTVISSHRFIIIAIITTFTMHHDISVPHQTQNLPFPKILPSIVSLTFLDGSHGLL